MSNFAIARQNMVDNQIRANKVTDPALIEAFLSIPREDFVPTGKETVAYVDEDLSLGGGRFLIEPMVLSRLLQEADIDGSDIVLDVGCCTGYSTAVISRIAASVIGIDENQDHIDTANENLAKLEIDNAGVILRDLVDGYPEQKPYSLIVINGAVEHLPEKLFEQLIDGGRLVAVIKESNDKLGKAKIYTKLKNSISSRFLFDAGTPAILSFAKAQGFQF